MSNEATARNTELDLINSIDLEIPKRKRVAPSKRGAVLTMRQHCQKVRQGWR